MPLIQQTTMLKHKDFFLLVAFLCLLLSLSSAHAKEDSALAAAEKIHISADSMNMNIETGNSVYIGHVKITQGELVLTGDTVTIEQQKELVERIIVIGQPASYIHVTKANEPIHATSTKMVYLASKNLLVLTENAELTQPEHTVKSEKIVYDTTLRTVVAGVQSPAAKKDQAALPDAERVNITLTPKPAETEN